MKYATPCPPAKKVPLTKLEYLLHSDGNRNWIHQEKLNEIGQLSPVLFSIVSSQGEIKKEIISGIWTKESFFNRCAKYSRR